MERATPSEREALVGDFVHEGVLEHVEQFRRGAPREEKFETREVAQLNVELCRHFPEILQKAERKLAPKDRGHLEESLPVVRQPIDASQEHLFESCRNRLCGSAALLDNHAGQLLEEEGIALGLRQDDAGYRIGYLLGFQNGREDFQAVLSRQRLKRHPGEVRSVDALRLIARSIG